MVERVFRQAFAICSARAYILPAIAVSAGTSVLIKLTLRPPPAPDTLSIQALLATFARLGVGLLISVVAFWPAASLLSLAIGIGRQETVSLGDRWIPFGLYLRALVIELVTGVVTLLGFICLLVPGFFAMVVWSQTLALLVDGRARFFDALDRSRDLTEGSRGDVFATLLCVLIVSAVGFGLTVALQSAMGMTSWPATLASILFTAPIAAFGIAARAGIYLELTAARTPLTRAEFYLAGPTADPAR